MKPLTCKELAPRIDAHLKRFEADPVINASFTTPPSKSGQTSTLKHFWHAGAGAHAGRVFVTYVGYQGHTLLTRDEAAAYLAWLDAGNVGRHFRQQHEAAKS